MKKNKAMKYKSKDITIASVTNEGLVTGKAAGNTAIEVRDDNGTYLGQIPTTVVPENSYIPTTGISLSRTSVSLKYAYDFSKQITATVTPSNATNKAVEWTSSDPSALSCVDGYLKCLRSGTGTFTVTAKAADGQTAICTVNIVENGTSVDGADPTVIVLDDSKETTVHIDVNTTDHDGYSTGYTTTMYNDTYGSINNLYKISNKTPDGFDLTIMENGGETRHLRLVLTGNFTNSGGVTINITQPYGVIVNRIKGSFGDISYCDKNGAFYFTYNDKGEVISDLGTLVIDCSEEGYEEIMRNTTCSEEWLTFTYSAYRHSDKEGYVGLHVTENTTGKTRTAYIEFPGGIKQYVNQSAEIHY